MFDFLFYILRFVILSIKGILRLGHAHNSVYCKIDGDFSRQIQKFRRLLRRVIYSLWKIVSSQHIFYNLGILDFVVTMWGVVYALYTVCLMGFVCNCCQRSKGILSAPTEQLEGSTTTFAPTSNTPKGSRSAISFIRGVERIYLSPVLDLVCIAIMLVPLVVVLPVLGLGMKPKIVATRLRLPSSSYSASTVTTSPTPSQPDTFRYRYLKTDSDYHSYLRHFGYYLRHSGYILCTVTIRWVTVTLIALGNLNFKNSSSCCLHVLRNIWLDSILSLLYALAQSDFQISLALNVWSSPLRERRFSEDVFSSVEEDLIGKNWWRYYNLYDCIMILNNQCKVSDYLNRHYQYKF